MLFRRDGGDGRSGSSVVIYCAGKDVGVGVGVGGRRRGVHGVLNNVYGGVCCYVDIKVGNEREEASCVGQIRSGR